MADPVNQTNQVASAIVQTSNIDPASVFTGISGQPVPHADGNYLLNFQMWKNYISDDEAKAILNIDPWYSKSLKLYAAIAQGKDRDKKQKLLQVFGSPLAGGVEKLSHAMRVNTASKAFQELLVDRDEVNDSLRGQGFDAVYGSS
jgi:predicted GNAT family acetyltransferase